MMKYITAIAAISGLVPACGSHETPPATPAPGRILYIPEDYSFPFDARPGDTLILVMNPDGGQLPRCDDAGGELILYQENNLWYCEDVDF